MREASALLGRLTPYVAEMQRRAQRRALGRWDGTPVPNPLVLQMRKNQAELEAAAAKLEAKYQVAKARRAAKRKGSADGKA